MRRLKRAFVAVGLIGIAAVFGTTGLSAQSTSTSGQTAPVTISSPSPIGDTTALAKEAQNWLIDLVRINTTNPPGNEEVAAKYIANVLQKEGITSELLNVAPNRSGLVARLRSSAVSDPSKALLLVAHMDVVGVDRAKWSVDPFGAVIKDGYMYGRGTIDKKACWSRISRRSLR